MGLLRNDDRDQLIRLLLQQPNIEEKAVRRILLAGLPSPLRATVKLSDIPLAELHAILDVADSDVWAPLPDGSYPVIRVIENAISIVVGSKLELELQALARNLRDRALASEDVAQLRAALQEALPSPSAVEQLLRSEYNQALETITSDTDLPDVIGDVIGWAERRGRHDLLSRALKASPNAPSLRRLAAQLGLLSSAPPVLGAAELPPAPLDPFSERLAQALAATLRVNELRQLSRLRLGVPLEGAAKGSSLADLASGLVRWAAEQGRADELLLGALDLRPDSAQLRELAAEAGLATVELGAETDAAAAQAILQTGDAWMAHMHVAAQAVCRVEIRGGTGLATGFLVGPDLVLTAHSAIVDAGGDVQLRFGYRRSSGSGAVAQGSAYRLAPDWLVDFSPVDALDFALLRVDGAPGDDPADGGSGARRWLVNVVGAPPAPGSPLACIQHPEGGPLKIAFELDSVVAVDEPKARLTYRLDTRPGSSGAPVLNERAELVALHTRRLDSSPDLKQGTLVAAIFARPKVRAALEG